MKEFTTEYSVKGPKIGDKVKAHHNSMDIPCGGNIGTVTDIRHFEDGMARVIVAFELYHGPTGNPKWPYGYDNVPRYDGQPPASAPFAIDEISPV